MTDTPSPAELVARLKMHADGLYVSAGTETRLAYDYAKRMEADLRAAASLIRELTEALEAAESALANSYQVVDFPANGKSEQDLALAKVRAALTPEQR